MQGSAMAMSEFEKRCLAVELLLIEVAPWLATGALEAAETAIRAGMVEGVCGDELEIRLHALELLQDGRRRTLPFSAGAWVRAAPK